jgi:hypothetical protein
MIAVGMKSKEAYSCPGCGSYFVGSALPGRSGSASNDKGGRGTETFNHSRQPE